MSTQEVKIYDEISLIDNIAPNTWIVDRAFSNDTLQWLTEIITNEDNTFQVSRPHRRLLLTPGEDFSRLIEIGQAIAPSLSKVTGIDLSLMDVKFWLDLPGFGCQPHYDSPDIIVSYQIYVNAEFKSADFPSHGVEFLHIDPPYEVELKANHGYINLNTDLKMHWVNRGAGTRTSVMFQFNRA